MIDRWYIAAYSHELRDRPLPRSILGRRLVLFRNGDGSVGALADRCAHRNMALSRGKVARDGLQCAYHGWVYNSAGKCVRIPAACGEGEHLGVGTIGIPSYAVAEKQDLVWVFVSGQEAASPPALPPDFPFLGEPHWQHWFMQRTFEGSAFNCVENFLDCPHTAHVHQGLFRSDKARENEIEITSGRDWVQAEFLNEERMDTLLGRVLFPHGERLRHTDRFMLPYVSRVDYYINERRHFIVMSQCTPISETRTQVYTYMAFRFDPVAPLIRLFYQPLAHRILDQDVDVIRELTEDLSHFDGPRFIYHPSDALAREMRDLLEGRSLEGLPPRRKRIAF